MRTMILAVAAAGIISACSPRSEVFMAEVELERTGRVAMPYTGPSIFVDPETGCEYFYYRAPHGGAMSPRYSSDGQTVMGCRDATR